MASSFSFGDPELTSTSALRKYCQDGRTMVRPLANELRISAEELHAALKEVPGGGNRAQQHVRARIVASHLKTAAGGIEVATAGLVRCFLSFERNFLNEQPQRSKRTFNLDK